MRSLVMAFEAARATRARGAKAEALAGAFAGIFADDGPDALATAARLATGRPLPVRDARTLGVGHALIFDAVVATGRTDDATLGRLSRERMDVGEGVGLALGAAPGAQALLDALPPSGEGSAPGRDRPAGAGHDGDAPDEGLGLHEVEALFDSLAATPGRLEKLALLRDTFARATALEATYLVKAMLGELRIGAQAGVALEALARAFGRPLDAVRRAAALVTDVGDLAVLAANDALDTARLEVGRPVAFMLASPIETLPTPPDPAAYLAEDKVDGIRAQVHVDGLEVRLFGRGLEDVTVAFPDVVEAVRGALPPGARLVLDGEIVVQDADGRPRPFQTLQPRLRKLAPPDELVAERPAGLVAFDLLFEGEALLDRPWMERRARLEALLEGRARVDCRALPWARLDGASPLAGQVDAAYDAARARGNEGVMLKRLDAPYDAGARGRLWLKVKRAFASLDVVVTAAQRGSGKRRDVLSDLTFAVRDGERFVDVGKAYSGLTDAEIEAMTERLGFLVEREERGVRHVRPEIVLEVGFDGLQPSARHPSGFALRFPRILRVRDDKAPEAVDTLDTVRALFARQVASGHREGDAVAGGAPARAKTTARKKRAASAPAEGAAPPVRQLSLFGGEPEASTEGPRPAGRPKR